MMEDVYTQRRSSTHLKNQVHFSDVLINLLIYIVLIIVAIGL